VQRAAERPLLDLSFGRVLSLGADLRGIVTLGSLEQGIAYAMGRKNRPGARRGA
jgi:hypothetical protein